jgi:hypothetical protein
MLSSAAPTSRAARLVNPKRTHSLVTGRDGPARGRGGTGAAPDMGLRRRGVIGPMRDGRGGTRQAGAVVTCVAGQAGAASTGPARRLAARGLVPPDAPRPAASVSSARRSGAMAGLPLRLVWTGPCASVGWRGRDCAHFTERPEVSRPRTKGECGRAAGERGGSPAAPRPAPAGCWPLIGPVRDGCWPPLGPAGPASVGIMLAGCPSAHPVNAVRTDVCGRVRQRTAFLKVDHLRPVARGRVMQMFRAIFYHGVRE